MKPLYDTIFSFLTREGSRTTPRLHSFPKQQVHFASRPLRKEKYHTSLGFYNKDLDKTRKNTIKSSVLFGDREPPSSILTLSGTQHLDK
jgi:hypothetical protein